MKPIKIVLILIGGNVFLLALALIVPVLIFNQSWWWFYGTLIGLIVLQLIVGFIFLIFRFRKKPVQKTKIEANEAKQIAIQEIRDDEDNPDNFVIGKTKLERWGAKGTEKTPIFILDGIGTELKQRRVVIMNLNNPKQEITKLTDPTDEEINLSVKLIAEHPPEEETVEERVVGVDEFGRPTTRIKTRIPSSQEVKQKKEESEADESGAM